MMGFGFRHQTLQTCRLRFLVMDTLLPGDRRVHFGDHSQSPQPSRSGRLAGWLDDHFGDAIDRLNLQHLRIKHGPRGGSENNLSLHSPTARSAATVGSAPEASTVRDGRGTVGMSRWFKEDMAVTFESQGAGNSAGRLLNHRLP